MVVTNDAAEMAHEFGAAVATGSVGEAADLLAEDGRAAVAESFPDDFREGPMDAEEALEQYHRGLYAQYGPFEEIAEVATADGGGDATVTIEFESGTETASVGVSDSGVTGLTFSPRYAVPAYVDEDAFTEREVPVDASDVSLDGILAVPEGRGPFPAVVLVHGAGIHDPDGTAGASKILRDLAWGLASEGVATLRYESRLADHDVADADRTLDTVVVDDAVAAVETLAGVEDVDEDALFVAGHSQGGMAAPRIAARHDDLAGVVALDARADSTHDPEDLTFMRYEFDPEGDLSEEQEAALERERETVRRLAEGDYDDDETIWGQPGTWHRSLLEYDPAGTASGLDAPVFVLKTGRADPETQADLREWFREEYEQWQAVALPAGSRVEFYEDVDHYFQPGYTPAGPMALYFGGNVAAEVLADIAAWLDGVEP